MRHAGAISDNNYTSSGKVSVYEHIYLCIYATYTRAGEETQEVAGSKSGGAGQSETPRKLSASENGVVSGMPYVYICTVQNFLKTQTRFCPQEISDNPS